MPSKPMRMPSVQVLRVREPNKKPENPCMLAMTTVLSCWASAGFNTTGCAALENALRNCMDHPPKTKQRSSNINYHLGRMYDKVVPHAKGK
ncbi:CHCH domain-containing protein [Colletotrichum zoysiae]|uniref:Small ribosomal subunit protein mS37 n=1 Tax=Colletotrichum zoysiae TaxID=1216348 RepID=A0AAD9HF29_9PEZI|nr:CHCH domain-containing protein [Colletotrichum zoysiae]